MTRKEKGAIPAVSYRQKSFGGDVLIDRAVLGIKQTTAEGEIGGG